jgi:hypothetical protein
MIRAPSNSDLSFSFVSCLVQIAEHHPARMSVHSEKQGHAICMCLALYCSPLGHSLFLLRDLVVTLHRSRAHTSEVCCEATSCASRSHLFRTCLRQAQRAACPAAAGRGDGRRRSDEAMTRTHSHVLPRLRSCARASHHLRRSGKVQGPPKPETAAPSPLGVVCSVPALTATSSDARGAAYLSGPSPG